MTDITHAEEAFLAALSSLSVAERLAMADAFDRAYLRAAGWIAKGEEHFVDPVELARGGSDSTYVGTAIMIQKTRDVESRRKAKR